MATTQSFIAQTRIFVEKITVDGSVIIPQGILQEINDFENVNWNTSNAFNKGGTVSMSNPLEKFTTSYRNNKIYFQGTSKLENEEINRYARDITKRFSDGREILNPDLKKEIETDNENYLLKDNFVIGTKLIPSYIVTSKEEEGFYLCPLQRIWIVTRTLGLGQEPSLNKERYTVWAGIIGGITESFTATGDVTLNLTLKPLSRILELTDMFQNYRILPIQGTLYDKYAKVLNDNLYVKYLGTDPLSILPPTSFLTLPVFLANFYYTKMGNELDYNLNPMYPYLNRGGDFFYQEPIWKLNTDNSRCWDQLVKGDEGMPLGRQKPYSDNGTDTLKDLWNGNAVSVVQMTPSVYIDPLIVELFNETGGLQLFQNKFVSSFQLIDNTMVNCREIIIKAAQAIFANAFEDDFGNIIMEVPRTWLTPNAGGDFLPDEKYDLSKYGGILHDSALNLDYVITDKDIESYSKSFDESNIVTYAEVPAQFQWDLSLDETAKVIFMTGRLKLDDPTISELQRRYGIRVLTTQPITANKINLGKTNADQYMKALQQIAHSALMLRNYTAFAANIETSYLHWLEVNKNILWLNDEALWLISDKTISYSQEGALRCSLTITMRHRINEKLGYPLLDIYIDEPVSVEGETHVIQSSADAKNIE